MSEPKTDSSIVLTIESYGERFMTFRQELYSFIAFLGETFLAIVECIRHPGKVRKKDLLQTMNTCGADGMPITILICLLVGIIIAWQAVLQMQKYGADRFLPMVVGCTILKEIGPLMVAIVATGRCGSAFAAEIATMKISEELDAMRTMGISPVRFIVVPKMYAMLLMIPLLTIVSDFAGIFGGFIVGYKMCGLLPGVYMDLTQSGVKLCYFFEGLAKSFIFAWLITQVGCWCGFNTGNDAAAVGRSTTSAVVLGLLAVIIADGILMIVVAQFYKLTGL